MADQIKNQSRPQTSGMRHPSWKFTQAKAQFSKVVQRALDGDPQRIVRSGRDAVIVVSEDQYNAATRPRRNLVDLFSALRGAELHIDRERDFGRDVPL